MGRVDTTEHMKGEFSKRISLAMKELLESKHLYQSVALMYEDLLALADREEKELRGVVRLEFSRLVKSGWIPSNPAVLARLAVAKKPNEAVHSGIWFRVPDVKLFCGTCGRIEPYNPVSCVDFLGAGHALVSSLRPTGTVIQALTISVLCQSCKQVPEVFLVRRKDLKLTLAGRAPIECIDVPPIIPKVVHPFYEGAVLAYQSGQHLPGNFMLRTLIEQWARQATGLTAALQAVQVLDSYMSSLPEDFKTKFPSLRALYGDLSTDIHQAIGSEELFKRAQTEIVEHFSARKLFKLGLPKDA